MIALMTLLAAVSLAVLAPKQRNGYTYMFVLKLIVINIYLVLTVFFTVKTSNFSSVFTWESSIYLILSRIKINYYMIFDLFTWAISVYITISMIMAVSLFPQKKRSKSAAAVCFMAPVLFFLYINLCSTSLNIHFALSDGTETALLAKYINAYNAAVISCYLAMPYFSVAYSTANTKIRYKKRYAFTMGLCMLAVDLISLAALWIAPYKSILFYWPDLLRTPGRLSVHITQNNVVFLIAGIAFLGVFTYIAAAKKIFDNINLNSPAGGLIRKKSKIYFKDTRPIFHTYKNTLLSIDLIAKTLELKKPPEDIKNGLDEIRSVIDVSIKQLVRLLDIYNDPGGIIEQTDMEECIRNAMRKAELPESVEVGISICGGKLNVNADGMLLEEVFTNLFKNSIEAIGKRANGKIDVRVITEGNWSCTYFRDNGCGIPKKNYSNIFKPLYSTKKTSRNWGIGLSFVSNVIMSMGGKITVLSRENEYTEFEILLPIEWQHGKYAVHKGADKHGKN